MSLRWIRTSLDNPDPNFDTCRRGRCFEPSPTDTRSETYTDRQSFLYKYRFFCLLWYLLQNISCSFLGTLSPIPKGRSRKNVTNNFKFFKNFSFIYLFYFYIEISINPKYFLMTTFCKFNVPENVLNQANIFFIRRKTRGTRRSACPAEVLLFSCQHCPLSDTGPGKK